MPWARPRGAAFPPPAAPGGEPLARGPWFDLRAEEGGALTLRLFGEVGWEVGAAPVAEALAARPRAPVRARINSVGGEVGEGLAILNALLRHEGPVTTSVEGYALSMGSAILMAGDEVEAMASSLAMLHNPWSVTLGDAGEHRRAADSLDRHRDAVAEAYMRRPGAARQGVLEWMDAETWFTAQEALEAGLVDRVVSDSQEIDMRRDARMINPARLRSVPDDVRAWADAAGGPAGADPEPEPAPGPAPRPSAAEEAARAERARQAAVRALFAGRPELAALRDECLDGGASEAEARERLDAALRPPAPEPTAGDAALAERARQAAIRRSFARHPGHGGLMERCLDEGDAPQAANERLLEALGAASGGRGAPPAPPAQVLDDARDRFLRGARAALLARAGIGSEEERRDDAANEFRGFSLHDLARHCLDRFHGGFRGDRMATVGAAFQHGADDFTELLGDVARRALLMGYDEQAEAYPTIARVVPLPDFRQLKVAGLSSFSSLEEVGEHGEYSEGDFRDVGENMRLSTYGRLFTLSRQAIVNDDVMAFTSVPRRMGRAGRRRIGDLVASLVAGDGHRLDQNKRALFAAANNNTGAAAPSTAAFDDMRVKMGTQKDAGGANVDVSPAFIWAPRALEGQCRVVNRSEVEVRPLGAERDATVPNSAMGIVREVVGDGRLDLEDAAAWYGLADPNAFDTLAVGLLDGVDEPHIEQHAQEARRDGVTWKVRIDATAEVLDFRGVYRGNNS